MTLVPLHRVIHGLIALPIHSPELYCEVNSSLAQIWLSTRWHTSWAKSLGSMSLVLIKYTELPRITCLLSKSAGCRFEKQKQKHIRMSHVHEWSKLPGSNTRTRWQKKLLWNKARRTPRQGSINPFRVANEAYISNELLVVSWMVKQHAQQPEITFFSWICWALPTSFSQSGLFYEELGRLKGTLGMCESPWPKTDCKTAVRYLNFHKVDDL